jgi:hypothetical protein
MTRLCSPKVTHQTGVDSPPSLVPRAALAASRSLVLLDTRHLRAFSADDIGSGILCPRAKRVLRVGHSIRAQVGQ